MENVERNLLKWQSQNINDPKSPHFKTVKAALNEDDDARIYTAEGGKFIIKKVNAFDVNSFIDEVNAKVNGLLSSELRNYYSENEQKNMIFRNSIG